MNLNKRLSASKKKKHNSRKITQCLLNISVKPHIKKALEEDDSQRKLKIFSMV